MDRWAEKQEAAKERKEAKQREKRHQKPEKQAAPSAEALARLDCPAHARLQFGHAPSSMVMLLL